MEKILERLFKGMDYWGFLKGYYYVFMALFCLGNLID